MKKQPHLHLERPEGGVHFQQIFIFVWTILLRFTHLWICIEFFIGVLLCSLQSLDFVLGCRTCSHFWYFQNLSPQPDTNDSISSGFDEVPPSEKLNVLWLVGFPSALWLANSLDGVSVLPRPFPEQQVHQYCQINSDQENIELEDRAEALHAWILQDIKMVMLLLLLLFFWAKSRFRWDVNDYVQISATVICIMYYVYWSLILTI